MASITDPAKRFWAKVQIGDSDACWLWTASFRKDGYGQMHKPGKHSGVWASHRAAWEFPNGPIPDGMCVCHACDNKACCNPKHLFLGSHADNVRDKISKGRQPRGEDYPHAKLVSADVDAIRRRVADGEKHATVAADFKLSQSTVTRIVHGKRWAHIPLEVAA